MITQILNKQHIKRLAIRLNIELRKESKELSLMLRQISLMKKILKQSCLRGFIPPIFSKKLFLVF